VLFFVTVTLADAKLALVDCTDQAVKLVELKFAVGLSKVNSYGK